MHSNWMISKFKIGDFLTEMGDAQLKMGHLLNFSQSKWVKKWVINWVGDRRKWEKNCF
jgi:hypothetical protein